MFPNPLICTLCKPCGLNNGKSSDIQNYQDSGRQRLADITLRRRNKNTEITQNLEVIIEAITKDRVYTGNEQKSKKINLF